MCFDQLPNVVRFEVFNGVVNSGLVQPLKWLQRADGAGDDGVLGPNTMAALLPLARP
ncbi:hypothetical protein [Delftia lacustris]|uniref:hypothetical protein n=1 Tax=Delftia lacustris TaxID=558537 RepID=UPI0035A6C9C8